MDAYIKGYPIQVYIPIKQTQKTNLGFQRTTETFMVLKTNHKLTLLKAKNFSTCNIIIKKQNMARIQLPEYPLPSNFLHCGNTFNE